VKGARLLRIILVVGIEKHLVGEFQAPGELPCDIHDEEGEKLDVVMAKLVHGAPGKDDDLAIGGGHGRNGVRLEAHERDLAEAFSDSEFGFVDGDVGAWNQQFDLAALDDVNMGGFLALGENLLSLFDHSDFQAAEEIILLKLGGAAENGDPGENREDFPGIFQGGKADHSRVSLTAISGNSTSAKLVFGGFRPGLHRIGIENGCRSVRRADNG